MTLVAFLETRTAEQEIDIPDGTAPPSLTKALADERLEKRAILTAWKAAAEAEGITDPAHADDPRCELQKLPRLAERMGQLT